MESEEQRLIPGLPNEIAISCLARIPLSNRTNIRSVCRGWRDIFKNDIFWDARRELSPPKSTWFLFQAPYPQGHRVWYVLESSKKEWSCLPRMPDNDSEMLVADSTASAVIDDKLFVIGGWFRCSEGGHRASSAVSCFDMKSYEWKKATSLIVARGFCAAGVIGKKLYVCVGSTHQTMKGWTETAEVYDPEDGAWTKISGMKREMISCEKSPLVFGACVLDGKLYVKCNALQGPRGFVYNPLTDEWSGTSRILGVLPKATHVNGTAYMEQRGLWIQVGDVLVWWARVDVDEKEQRVYVRAYNSIEDNWECVSQLLIRKDVRLEWTDIGRELLVFEENLSMAYLQVHGQDDLCRYVIRDLEDREITSSKSFCPGNMRGRGSLAKYEGKPELLKYQIMVF